MHIFVDGIYINDMIIKIFANVVVIMLNYIASVLLIFGKRGGQ